ncbi:MAG: amino acid adenylation domain-containing protein [Defluviitaleaceae bacterium]|nr:amino acid adenylation domain-containing protein [Defluviitaleaceae bacterium]
MAHILDYLEVTAITHADKPAFIGEAGFLTFAQLHDRARKTGAEITDRGIYKKPVVVFMQKSADMVAAFCGVVYAGCYYVPIDAEMPAYRIRQIFETTQPALVICDDTTLPLLSEWAQEKAWDASYEAVLFDDISAGALRESDVTALANIRRRAIDTDAVYVVFTSGSTGMPKGVTACHRSVVDYIEQLSTVLEVDEHTVFGNQSPLYLDACLKELLPTMKYGATTYFIPKSLFMFPVKLIEYLNEHHINNICWVASALGLVAGLNTFAKVTPYTLRTIAFGSEVFAAKHLNQWRTAAPDAQFIHLYGPTEATGMSLFYKLDRDFAEGDAIPIGRPFANTDILLFDENGNEPPPGQPGEICIRGTCLCLGYYNDPERTSATFVQNPRAPYADLMYKTGDLGYIGTDGNYYFLARKDHQIKHMGYRIELTEIEWVAMRIPGVQLACAIFDGETSRIILYYMGDETAPKSAVQAALKTQLPRYMMPQAIFPIPTLPQTPGGKIDRVQLLNQYRESVRATRKD